MNGGDKSGDPAEADNQAPPQTDPAEGADDTPPPEENSPKG